jgi:superfamily II DNA or RNA helicase
MSSELIGEKSRLILQLEDAKRRKSTRDVFDLASKAAALEGKIARDLILADRDEDALINLISQATCFGDAKRFIEKERVLHFAAELAIGKRPSKWIAQELEKIVGNYPNPASVFISQPVHISGNSRLRRPQEEAYAAAKEYFSDSSNNHAIVQLPVGCGKTGAIAILPFGIAKGRMLVVAPNLIIRDNLFKNLDSYGQASFLRNAEVLRNGQGPTCALLTDDANIRDCDEAAIVIANIQQLVSGSRDKWLSKLPPDFFDMIVMDEGHHNVAPTWRESLAHFPDAKITSFTATPFRADGQKVDGKRIYRFPVEDAIREGYVKDIASHRIEPQEITFTYKGESTTHTLAEVMKLKEKDWFSKGIALSSECNRGIVDHSITCMRELRSNGSAEHSIIAVACSIDHARSVRAMYDARGLKADVIHSELAADDQARILRQLERSELDVIVQVQMLGEGADFPKLSVAAIFRPFRNLVPYVQFVGRIMRVVKQDSPGDPDNRGYVVSHVGLNVDRWWSELKDLDEDDQEFFEELATSDRAFLLSTGINTDQPPVRRRFMPQMVVLEETIAHYVKERFLAEDVNAVADDVINALQLRGLDLTTLGLSRESLESKIMGSMGSSSSSGLVIEQSVQPQRERQISRQRLQERVKSAAKELLNELHLSIPGRDIPRLFPQTGAINNLAGAIMMLNLQVQEFLGLGPNERDIATTEQLKRAHDLMDDLVDAVAEKVRSKKG